MNKNTEDVNACIDRVRELGRTVRLLTGAVLANLFALLCVVIALRGMVA